MNPKRVGFTILALLASILLIVACARTAPPPVEVTRVVEVTREVPVEVTKVVEVTRQVPIEVTRVVTQEVPVEVKAPSPADLAYEWLPTSLHGTTAGMRYFYAKENGGMEILTGIPYEDLPCKG